MSKQISLMILIVISGLVYFGLGERVEAMVSGTALVDQPNVVNSFAGRTSSSAVSQDGSTCAGATTRDSSACLEAEQQILATTLRIEIRTWIMYVEEQGYISYYGDGHGTVMGGRYLLTHNHFQVPLLDLLADSEKSELATVTLYTSDGQQLWQGPLTAIEVASEDSESLLLEFQDQDGRGFFEKLGIPSADLDALTPTSIQVGTEVAQINWDRNRAHVQWTKVMAITHNGGTPVIRLSDCIVLGASGGGVFVDNIHIANNWSRSFTCDGSSDGATPFLSTAALNSTALVAVTQ
jgi:hypothetical protein